MDFDQWPFKHFLNLPEVQFLDNLFTQLFKFWDFESNCFNFNGNLVAPTADDFCVNLGLSGCSCDIEQKKKKLQVDDITGDLAKKFSPDTAIVKWKLMEDKLNYHLTDKSFATPEEWFILFSVYFLATTLFSRSSDTIPMFLFNYLSKFDDLWSIKWGHCAYEVTIKNFKELVELLCDRREVGKPAEHPSLQGCPLGLLLWLFEILQPMGFRIPLLGT